MDTWMLSITTASLLVAAVTSIVAWRLWREHQERSAARVAALAAAIADGTAVAAPLEGEDAVSSDASDQETTITTPGGLFAAPRREGTALAQLGPALLAGTIIVAGVLASVGLLGGGDGTVVASSDPVPIELLSLRHALADGELSVTGLVRNPIDNQRLERLTAVVFLFDAAGGFLASGRSLIDFMSLAPGEDSPFVVTVDAPPGVERYRVSFRLDEGGVLQHVDRREARVP